MVDGDTLVYFAIFKNKNIQKLSQAEQLKGHRAVGYFWWRIGMLL